MDARVPQAALRRDEGSLSQNFYLGAVYVDTMKYTSVRGFSEGVPMKFQNFAWSRGFQGIY